MKRSNRLNLLLGVAIVAAVAIWPVAQVAYAAPSAPTVPTEVQVPDGNKMFLVGHAVGVQIYSCNAAGAGYSWGLVAPRADLYGDNGKLVATHFGGPTWRATDGSYVVGHRLDGVTVDPTAIAWLKLDAASSGSGDGDRLAGTTFIQRVATTGGLAPPAVRCNAAAVGTIEEIPYTADYYFWK
jgi:hypothetical protein